MGTGAERKWKREWDRQDKGGVKEEEGTKRGWGDVERGRRRGGEGKGH